MDSLSARSWGKRAVARPRLRLVLAAMAVLLGGNGPFDGATGAGSLSGAAAQAAEAKRYEVELTHGVVFAKADDEELQADICSPKGEGPFPAVICIHGGAWAIGTRYSMLGIAHKLARRGMVAMTIDYRLAPKSKYPAQIEDCRAAIHWLQEHAAEQRVDAKRLALWGYSAGGHLALLAATEGEKLRCVVAGGAPADLLLSPTDDRVLAFWLGGSRARIPEIYEEASPITHVDASDPPVFLYHGRFDALVPYSVAIAMQKKLKAADVPVELYTIPVGGHLVSFVDPTAIDRGVDFLVEHLEHDGR